MLRYYCEGEVGGVKKDGHFHGLLESTPPDAAGKNLLYSKIGAIAWRHLAIPVRHLIPCQIINFCESAYKPTTTSDIIPVNCEAVKLYTKRLY